MKNYDTELYFEAHVTIDPVEERRLDELRKIAKSHQFRVAELIMHKGGKNPDDAFMTARSSSYRVLIQSVTLLVRELNYFGFNVRRYKIENTIMDSKYEQDPLGVLQ